MVQRGEHANGVVSFEWASATREKTTLPFVWARIHLRWNWNKTPYIYCWETEERKFERFTSKKSNVLLSRKDACAWTIVIVNRKRYVFSFSKRGKDLIWLLRFADALSNLLAGRLLKTCKKAKNDAFRQLWEYEFGFVCPSTIWSILYVSDGVNELVGVWHVNRRQRVASQPRNRNWPYNTTASQQQIYVTA